MVLDLFRTDRNDITIRNRVTNKAVVKKFMNDKQLDRIVRKQNPDTDIYINKYPRDKLVDTVILDFDSEDVSLAKKDVVNCSEYVLDCGLDTTIVKSGKKGYHLYIRIPLTDFKGYPRITKDLFNTYTNYLIGGIEKYPTFDETNFASGLRGNIRVVGSIHPVSGERCQVVQEYSGCDLNIDYSKECFEKALVDAKVKDKERRERLNSSMKLEYGNDPIKDNDLMEVFPRLFGGDVKNHDGYIFMVCPFHPDHNPSLMITKEFFKCQSCGTKGNIWYLIHNNYLKRSEV